MTKPVELYPLQKKQLGKPSQTPVTLEQYIKHREKLEQLELPIESDPKKDIIDILQMSPAERDFMYDRGKIIRKKRPWWLIMAKSKLYPGAPPQPKFEVWRVYRPESNKRNQFIRFEW